MLTGKALCAVLKKHVSEMDEIREMKPTNRYVIAADRIWRGALQMIRFACPTLEGQGKLAWLIARFADKELDRISYEISTR